MGVGSLFFRGGDYCTAGEPLVFAESKPCSESCGSPGTESPFDQAHLALDLIDFFPIALIRLDM